jgi:hypothetical protein
MPIEAHAQGYWIKIKRKTLLRSGSTDLGDPTPLAVGKAAGGDKGRGPG